MGWRAPPTIDPALTADGISAGIVVEVFSGLVSIESGDTGLVITPELAESWSIDDDGRTYTFKLRNGATFHDGKPVTAQDVKFSIERALNPSTTSPVASLFLDDILGAQDFAKGVADEVVGVRVVDSKTVEIVLEVPRAFFLAKLTHPVAFVVDEVNVGQGGAWFKQPNGTGPFRLERWDLGEKIVLRRNDRFYKRPAYLDTVTLILSGGQPDVMYETDAIDVMAVDAPLLDRVLDPNNPLSQELTWAIPDFSVTYIAFNNNLPPFDDRNVRQAFNHAIDKEKITEVVGAGLNIPAYGILPPNFPGHDPDLDGLRFNAERARQLLEESKYGGAGGLPLILLTVPTTGEGVSLEIQAILEMWRLNLGVEVEVQRLDFATFLQEMFQGNIQAFNLQWVPDYLDPHSFLDVLFHSDSANNTIGYQNERVDELLDEARESLDLDRRISLYGEAEEIIVADAPWIPLWFSSQRPYLVKPQIHGFEPLPLFAPYLKNVYIRKD